MKNLIFICCILAATNCYAQKDTVGLKMPFKDGRLIYEEVVVVPERSKMELYKNTKQWFVDEFKSSKDVIQSEDKEDGKIIGKGIIPIYYNNWAGTAKCTDLITIQIECKDGKYRYKIYDMVLNSDVIGDFTPQDLITGILGGNLNGKKMYTKKISRAILLSIDDQTKSLVTSIKKTLSAKPDDF